MAINISTLSVKLTANTLSFAQNMAKAAQPLASFGGSVLKVGGMLTGFGTALAGLAAGGSLVYLTQQSMEAIDVNSKLADRLGLSTEGLTGLQHAGNLAGVSSEALTGGLEKMLKALGGAADDGELASNAFTKLGLNANQLANMPADQAFSTIAQKISEIANPTERATAAMQIFGKAGQSLLPLMMSGAEGIKAAQEEAAKLGLTYSRVDAAKVEQANDAITRMSSIFTGISNQLAIGLAPYIEAVAAKFTELATTGGGVGPLVGGAIEWVAKAIATASDYLQLLPAGFHGFRAGALEAIAGVLGAIDTLGSGLVQFMNLLPGVSLSWTDTFSTLQQGMEQVAGEEAGKMDEALGKFSRGDNAASVSKTFDDIRQKSAEAAQATADNAEKMKGAFKGLEDSTANLKKVGDTLADLRKQVDQFGMSDAQKKVSDLKANGGSPEQVAQAEADLKKLDALNAQKKAQDDMQAKAKQVFDDTRTPMEKYEEKVGELSDMLNAGAIDWTTYGRAIQKARGELEGKDKVADAPTLQAPDLIQSGSAQAARFAYDLSHGQQNVADKKDTGKAQLVEAKDTNDTVRFAFDGDPNHEAGFEVNATRGISFGTIVWMTFAGYDTADNPVFLFSHQVIDPWQPITPHDHRDNNDGGFSFATFHPGTTIPQMPWAL